jgi:hypothetical protein
MKQMPRDQRKILRDEFADRFRASELP